MGSKNVRAARLATMVAVLAAGIAVLAPVASAKVPSPSSASRATRHPVRRRSTTRSAS